MENILFVWRRFLRGKRNRKDVLIFESRLSDNLAEIYKSLVEKTYQHGPYSAFNVSDPKPRNIHKASVRDRVMHHLIHKELYPYFDIRFIYDSFSCRKNKGTHRAIDRFRSFARKVSKNHTKTCFVLKCDIRKFFASIDHEILKKILERHIADTDILVVLGNIIDSFSARQGLAVGLPLGNLTSQLLVNIYMHEFDMYVKQELRVKYYIRYADDFVVLSDDRSYVQSLLKKFHIFLREELNLDLHEDKVYIKTYGSGVDFLGWIHFPYHRQLRTTTKRKVLKKIKNYPKRGSVNSYCGLLRHGNTYELQKTIGMNFL